MHLGDGFLMLVLHCHQAQKGLHHFEESWVRRVRGPASDHREERDTLARDQGIRLLQGC